MQNFYHNRLILGDIPQIEKSIYNGYFLTATDTTVYKLQFSNNAIVTTTSIGSARNKCTSVVSPNTGYACAGQIGGTDTATVSKLPFATEAWSENILSISDGARNSCAGINSLTKGYICGGFDSAARAYIDGLQFNNEAAVNPTATLANGIKYLLGGCNSKTKGYIAGGNATSVDVFTYATEACANWGSTLPDGAIYWPAAWNSSTYGYFAGGFGAAYYNYIQGINFSNDAVYNPSSVLATVRGGAASCNSSSNGYVGQGWTTGNTACYTLDVYSFATDTLINSAAIFAIVNIYAEGFQSGSL